MTVREMPHVDIGFEPSPEQSTSSCVASPATRERTHRRTKIVCTLGPATHTVDMITELLYAGMNVARLNFSHGDHEYHAETVRNVREASKQTGIPCALLLDTKGPEIRTGKLKNGEPILLKTGMQVRLHCSSTPVEGFVESDTQAHVYVDYADLPRSVKQGDVVKIDDGLIVISVIATGEDWVIGSVQNTAELGERKGVNLPGCVVNLPALTAKDKRDVAFGLKHDMDMIALSFTRKAEDVHAIHSLISEINAETNPGALEELMPHIICKIESQEGLHNFDEILEVADGIMVARGDLGVEIPIQKVCMAQKTMIARCNQAGKPVITATQMLESMVKNPRPTRAEAGDVANAVFDGSDCVMLSGETAKGAYPVQAVKQMSDICIVAERGRDYQQLWQIMVSLTPRMSQTESVCSSAVKTACDLQAPLILILTESGFSARSLSKFKPSQLIVAATPHPKVAAQLLTSQSVVPLVLPRDRMSNADEVKHALQWARQHGLCHKGDDVVVVTGRAHQVGSSNTMTVHTVGFDTVL